MTTYLATLRERILPGRRPRLQVFLFCIVAWCIALFAYGIVTYTDMPYKPCFNGEFNGQYCGKRGAIQPPEKVESWKQWEGLLFASWPFGIMAGFALSRLRRQD
jgi:hypothetical protein